MELSTSKKGTEWLDITSQICNAKELGTGGRAPSATDLLEKNHELLFGICYAIRKKDNMLVTKAAVPMMHLEQDELDNMIWEAANKADAIEKDLYSKDVE